MPFWSVRVVMVGVVHVHAVDRDLVDLAGRADVRVGGDRVPASVLHPGQAVVGVPIERARDAGGLVGCGWGRDRLQVVVAVDDELPDLAGGVLDGLDVVVGIQDDRVGQAAAVYEAGELPIGIVLRGQRVSIP